MNSNYKQSSVQIILDLINFYNGTAIKRHQVDFGAITPTEGKQVHLVLHSRRGGGFYGDSAVYYNRVDLAEIPYAANGQEHEYDVSTASGVLDFINSRYGVKIDATDVAIDGQDLLDADFPVSQEYDVPQAFVITAKPTSPVWIGSLTINLTKTRVKLQDIWTVTILEGLDIENPFPWPAGGSFAMGSDGVARAYADGSVKRYLPL